MHGSLAGEEGQARKVVVIITGGKSGQLDLVIAKMVTQTWIFLVWLLMVG